VHGHDAGVIELARHLGLFQEPSERALVDRRRRPLRERALLPEDDLHREMAPQRLVPHAQDRALPAAADLALDRVARRGRRELGQLLHQGSRGRRERLRSPPVEPFDPRIRAQRTPARVELQELLQLVSHPRTLAPQLRQESLELWTVQRVRALEQLRQLTVGSPHSPLSLAQA
jgi:hypothetical protein